jgi:MGT family glycosyltransferase
MAEIAFFSIPAYGHIHPALEVVKELVNRGHHVKFYSYDTFQKQIEEAGAEFVSCSKMDPQTRLKPEEVSKIGKDLAFSTELIVDMTLALDDATTGELIQNPPDVIVADSMAYWAKLIAQKLEIPFVESVTTFAISKESAKEMQSGGPGLFSVIKSMPGINKSLKRLRAKGYPVKSVLDIVQSNPKTRTIVYTSRYFQPHADSFPENFLFTGPLVRQAKENKDWKEDRNLPLVYVSLGTVNSSAPQLEEFYRNTLQALKNLPVQAVISGANPKMFDQIPSNCRIYDSVDQISILKQADVFITHCGMNSISESLSFGVLPILYPQTPEQNGAANRVRELQAGIRLDHTDVPSIQAAVEKALDTGLETKKMHENIEMIKHSFQKAPGRKAAADFILQSIR